MDENYNGETNSPKIWHDKMHESIVIYIIGIYMRKIILLLSIILVASSLYTSSYWTKKGFDVKDGEW